MLIRRLGWMAAVAMALLVLGLAFRARQTDETSAGPTVPPPQSRSPAEAGEVAKDQRSSRGTGVGTVSQTPIAPESSARHRTAVTAHWGEIAIDGARVPKPDLSEPYPFTPGETVGLDAPDLLEVLKRFYGAVLPKGWRVERLELPGGGHFELSVDAAGETVVLRGELTGTNGYANVTLDDPGKSSLTIALPPGMESIELTRDAARINRR